MAGASASTYWIVEERQLEALASPRRHDIIDRLAASGPLSIKELAEQIGAQTSALYHHVSKLLKVGLVIEAGSRVVHRRREQLYATPAPRMRLARALAEDRHPALLADIARSLTRQMARDFEVGAGSPSKRAEGEDRNLGFFRLTGRPGPVQLARINACLAEVAEILWTSTDPQSPVLSLGWVMAPIDQAPAEPDREGGAGS